MKPTWFCKFQVTLVYKGAAALQCLNVKNNDTNRSTATIGVANTIEGIALHKNVINWLPRNKTMHTKKAKRNAAVKYYDARTWPKSWTARDIQHLLQQHLATSATSVNYDVFALLHHAGDEASLNILLRAYTETNLSEEVDMKTFLDINLTTVQPKAAFLPLQDRASIELSDRVEKALKPIAGSEKRRIVFCSSSSGSGKTEFVKLFTSSRRAAAMKCGRVIVRCCAKQQTQWVSGVMAESLKKHEDMPGLLPKNSIDRALCELVRAHVELVTGYPQDPSNYCDPQTAYATWVKETARCFRIAEETVTMQPLIILDSCEVLAREHHKYLVHRSSGKPYTMLEAFCLSVPSPYGIFVIGCETNVNTSDPVLLALANVIRVDSQT
ncbi:Bodo-specific multi-copy gene family, putative [Bodo saltans]|uniref:Bodo-specific multi-copy gene family, putative n=1 Tax=Bodo saltans TaxID=75058 RepID=A0A0S4IHD0_BODSA|nr:Bodo-specific multi-copy gene family, putative [Bodo saltans]|eukprot:CUE63816.1 Bodo-specific multi-copy gene family, putative [Bodo saltans]